MISVCLNKNLGPPEKRVNMKLSTVLTGLLGLLTAFPNRNHHGTAKLTSLKLHQWLTNSVSVFQNLTGKNILHIRHITRIFTLDVNLVNDVILGNS